MRPLLKPAVAWLLHCLITPFSEREIIGPVIFPSCRKSRQVNPRLHFFLGHVVVRGATRISSRVLNASLHGLYQEESGSCPIRTSGHPLS